MTKNASRGVAGTSTHKTTRRGAARKRAGNNPSTSSLPQLASSDDTPYLTGKSERAIYNRLSRLEGQVRGVKRMLAEHKSCDEMLVQVSALKQAVNGIAAELLQAHMETCVRSRVEAGDGQRALASLRDALAKVMKHG